MLAQGRPAQGGHAGQRDRGRTQLLRMYGAEIIYSPGRRVLRRGARWRWSGPRRTPRSTCLQYGNQATRIPTPRHRVARSRGADEVRAFVGGLAGGTLMGNARRLKEENDETIVVAAERSRASRPGAALPGGRIHPADHRPGAAGPQDLRVQQRRGRLDQEAARAGGPMSWGVSSGAIAADRGARWPASWTRATSCSWPRRRMEVTSAGVYSKSIEELEADGALERRLLVAGRAHASRRRRSSACPASFRTCVLDLLGFYVRGPTEQAWRSGARPRARPRSRRR